MVSFTFVGGSTDAALQTSVVAELSATRVVPTRPAPAAGFLHVLVVDDAGAQSWVKLQKPAAGATAGKVLTSDGTDLVWVAANAL